MHPKAHSYTQERRCLGCRMSKSVRSFKVGGALCKQCRDNGPPAPRTEPTPVVDEKLEAHIRQVRDAVLPRRAGV